MSSIPHPSSGLEGDRQLWRDGLAGTALLGDGRSVVLRPIRPEDEAAHFEFATHVTPTDAHFPFLPSAERGSAARDADEILAYQL